VFRTRWICLQSSHSVDCSNVHQESPASSILKDACPGGLDTAWSACLKPRRIRQNHNHCSLDPLAARVVGEKALIPERTQACLMFSGMETLVCESAVNRKCCPPMCSSCEHVIASAAYVGCRPLKVELHAVSSALLIPSRFLRMRSQRRSMKQILWPLGRSL